MPTAADDLYDGVRSLLGLPHGEAVAEVVRLAGGDRDRIVVARDRCVAALRARTDDFEATRALTLLNRVLAEHGPDEPLDWKRRWAVASWQQKLGRRP